MLESVADAMKVIKDESAGFAEKVHAAEIVCSCKESTLHEIIACLECGGVAKSFAVIELYIRTGRERAHPELSLAADPSVVTDADDWHEYVSKHK